MNIGIKDVFQQIKLFSIIYLTLLGACLVVFFTFTKQEIYFAVNGWNSRLADVIMPYITALGNGWTTVTLAAILALYSYRKAFLLAGAYAVTSLVAQLIKAIVGAPRPKLFFQAQLSRIHFVKGLYTDMHGSFPSGHSVTAFSTALIIAYLLKNKYWGVLLVLTAALVGYSRMYLSEHFFEDVAGGSVIGVFFTIVWIKWMDNKQFLHRAKWQKGLLR